MKIPKSLPSGLRSHATIEVKQNLHLVMRERGKIIARRDGHNIWVNLGREFLASLIAYSSMSPLTPERNDRVRYMGLGIGGSRQLALSVANAAPIVTAYPGSNVNVDTDPTVTTLERPVRISGSSDAYPGQGTDVWIGQVQAPATHTTASEVTFKRLFSQLEVSYSPFLTVPLSEIGLFTNSAATNVYNNNLIAYDTFDTLSKTNAFDLQINWTIRF